MTQCPSWAWAFGDGGTSAEQHPSHLYTNLGTYTATVVPTDDDGDSGSAGELRVRVVNLPPAPDFAVEEYPMILVPVEFEDRSSDRDGDVVAWAWSFGDGGESEEQHPTHVFLEGGWHTVSLRVTDNDGGAATLVREVYVCAPGVAADPLLQPGHVRLEVEGCVHVNGGELPL